MDVQRRDVHASAAAVSARELLEQLGRTSQDVGMALHQAGCGHDDDPVVTYLAQHGYSVLGGSDEGADLEVDQESAGEGGAVIYMSYVTYPPAVADYLSLR